MCVCYLNWQFLCCTLFSPRYCNYFDICVKNLNLLCTILCSKTGWQQMKWQRGVDIEEPMVLARQIHLLIMKPEGIISICIGVLLSNRVRIWVALIHFAVWIFACFSWSFELCVCSYQCLMIEIIGRSEKAATRCWHKCVCMRLMHSHDTHHTAFMCSMMKYSLNNDYWTFGTQSGRRFHHPKTPRFTT